MDNEVKGAKSEYVELLTLGMQQSRWLMTRRNFKILCLSVLIFIVYYGYQIYDDKIIHFYQHDSYEAPCQLPEVDPFDPEMMKYVWRPDPLECHKNPTPVVYVDDNNILQFNDSALVEVREAESSVHCDYFNILRSQEQFKVDKLVDFSEAHPCNPPMDIKEDFFRVTCTGKRGKKLFDNTLTKIVKTKRKLENVDPNDDKYNIMLFGIDSLSRAAAIRQLPNMFKYLTRDLESYDFKGYTKVNDNTFPNIIPLLTGFVAYSEEIPRQDFMTEYLNDYPFIWKNFSDNGYATMFAEDLPNLGAFNLDKIGFKEYPTDHYMRPYWLGNFKLTPMHNFVTNLQRVLQNSNIKVAPSAICNGNVPNHVTLTNYLKQFMLTYRKERKFMFSFLTELSHEFQNFLNLGDNDLLDFLKWMKKNGFMDDTIVIVFGDHGMKFGNNQHLFSARIESRLPLLQIVLPNKLTDKYPKLLKNMRTNENRLSSTFDLHATIRDVLHSNYENPTKFYLNDSIRGISLFEELSKDRSCKDANIGPSYCACYKSDQVNVTNNPDVKKMALKSVAHLNNLLKDSPECAHLELNFTDSARKVSQRLKPNGMFRRHNLWFSFHIPEAEERDDTKYVLVFTTTPGGGKFYSTCSFNKETDSVTVLGNIDRINRYDANIGPSYCACYKSDQVNVTNNPDVKKMALKSVAHLNNLLKDSPECAHLELNFTDSARKVSQRLKPNGMFRRHNLWFSFHIPEAEERDDTKYVLVFTTTPGGGKFYSTCSFNKETDSVTVLGNIDRINRYGKQPHCVHKEQLRPFCLCNDMIGNDNYKR